jgi:2-succinyl-6-hydroxy-2,4-cyclohexadiene-1-carboxylate synthase
MEDHSPPLHRVVDGGWREGESERSRHRLGGADPRKGGGGPAATGGGGPAATGGGGPERRGGRVVLVHGFTQTLGSWEAVGERLGERWEVVRVDLPGHGGSGAVRAGFEAAAGLVGEAGGRAAYVGYSLGGRLCLRLALDRPELVPALALLGASPGIADPAGRAERLANTADGLAWALRALGTGAQEPLWDRLAGLRPPTLLLAGELDHKFTAIARQMAAAIGPTAEVALVPGAGHAAHLERPAEVAARIGAFLAAHL